MPTLTQNKAMKRGDRVTLKFVASGNIVQTKLSFVMKESTEITADRIIEKRNSLAGGSAKELSATFDESLQKTVILVEILTADTNLLPAGTYPFDIESVSMIDASDVHTPIDGKLVITADVQTPLDGWTYPKGAKRFAQVDASLFNNGDFIQAVWNPELQQMVFKPLSMIDLRKLLGLI